MKQSALPIVWCLFFYMRLNAQDISYAKAVVEELASHKMKGRGYVKGGDRLAAMYIRNQFEKIGVKAFDKKYFQEFSTPVSTYPGAIRLEIDGNVSRPGEDFLVASGSPSIKGVFSTLELNAGALLNDRFYHEFNDCDKCVAVIDFVEEEYTKEEHAIISRRIRGLQNKKRSSEPEGVSDELQALMVVGRQKLIWSPSSTAYDRPLIRLNGTSVDDRMEQVYIEIEQSFVSKYITQNVIGYVEGERNDSLIVFTAHYDHLGMLGKETIFPGANDNASGVAMLLDLAKHYRQKKPAFHTVFIAFGAEELGLLGSSHFIRTPLFDLDKIKFLINFDMAGTGDDGIQVVNGSVFKKQFDELSAINEKQGLLPWVKIRGEACNSDHCPFYQKGVPSFFIYTLGGIQAYHDIHDRPETLPLTEYEDYFKLITLFVEQL